MRIPFLIKIKTLVAAILASSSSIMGQVVTISGFVRQAETLETLPFTNIVVGQHGSASNSYGFFSITVQQNEYVTLRASRVGFELLTYSIHILNDTTLDLLLTPATQQLREITVSDSLVNETTGFNTLTNYVIQRLPGLLGEKDPLKAIQLLPGVQKGLEGTTGIYSRGGDPGQNLIVMDDATIYNANHMFGFFSVFNGDAIKQVNFWKGGFPARYGGRISSVIDIKMKDGDRHRTAGEVTTGLLSSKFRIEGPLDKKSSYMLSARRTYFDLLLGPFMDDDSKFKYRFYDMNFKINRQLGSRDKLFLSYYSGNDAFQTLEKNVGSQSTNRSEAKLGWGNSSLSFRWNHIFNSRIFVNSTIAFTDYKFQLADSYSRTGSDPVNEMSRYSSGIKDLTLKSDMDFFHSNSHLFTAGFEVTAHHYRPSVLLFTDATILQADSHSEEQKALEGGLYIQDHIALSTQSSLDAGTRLSTWFSKGSNYFFPEPRLTFNFKFSERLKFIASYTRANQFVHLLTNTGPGLPTDLWVPAGNTAPPQRADIGSLSVSKILSHGFSISLEGYAKAMRNIISYSENPIFQQLGEGAKMMNWENNIASGNAEAYGLETLVKKENGILFGSLAYTLSTVYDQFKAINSGRRFHPQHDSRHVLNLFLTAKCSERLHFSLTWQYNSGTPFTVPEAYYFANSATGADVRGTLDGQRHTNEPITRRIQRMPYFAGRNNFRGEAYHRLDIAIQFHKSWSRSSRYWGFGLFNAYNRRNPFYYYLQSRNDPSGNGQIVSLKKKAFLPILPSVAYNYKF